MPDNENKNGDEVGYGKPPKATQFVKGKSGNPKGRPKGSKNLSTVINDIGKQRVKVIENGRERQLSKFEAVILQLMNKALQGEIKAANELRYWMQAFCEFVQVSKPSAFADENDKAVMASMLGRVRAAVESPAETAAERSTDLCLEQ